MCSWITADGVQLGGAHSSYKSNLCSIHSNIPHPLSTPTPCFSHRPLSDSDHTMEIWFECTTSGQRCAAEVGEGCSAADLQERAVAVLYPQSVVSAEAVGLCVDGADGEVLAPEVLIAHTALCAGGTVYVSRRKQDSSGVWVPKRYTVRCSSAEVCEGTLVIGGEDTVTINLVTTEVTPLPPIGGRVFEMVLMPHHIVYCGAQSYTEHCSRQAVNFRRRDSGAEVVVRMARMVLSLVAMRVTKTVLIGTREQIVQYSCEGVKMRTIDHCGYAFAVSPCETLLFINGSPTIVVYRLDTPELSVVHRVDTGLRWSSCLKPTFSPDASLAVVSCGEKHTVRTIDIVSGRVLCTLPNGGYTIHGVCFSACSRYLFTAYDRGVQQWDARSGAPRRRTHAIYVGYARSVHASRDGCRLLVVAEQVISVLDIAAINMQEVSEQDALQHGPPRPLPSKATVVATESRCCRCVCS